MHSVGVYRCTWIDDPLDNISHSHTPLPKTTHKNQVVYVGLPLPFSGAWTAMFWSAAFGMKFGPSALGALVGVGLSTLVGLALWLTGACVWLWLWLWLCWMGVGWVGLVVCAPWERGLLG